MSGRWHIASIDGIYKIQKNNDLGIPSDYLTITSNGNVGISNSSPLNKLDIIGNVSIDGKTFLSNDLFSSNILGYEIANVNHLKINKTSTSYVNNVLEIYGKTLLTGKMGIGISNPQYEIDVDGSIKGHVLIGNGSNITNIHTSNITKGVLDTSRGGTGLSVINNSQLLVGGNANNIIQYSLLNYNPNTNTLSSPNITGDGRNITNINALQITEGPLRVAQGGTGVKTLLNGAILVGNGTGVIATTNLLNWEKINDTSYNLNIGGNIKLPSLAKIYINENPFAYSDIGVYQFASRDNVGIIRIGPDFDISQESGIISLANIGSSKWGLDTTTARRSIFFPTDTTIADYSVSIGDRGELANNFKLNVSGDINTTNGGVYKINGVNVVQNNSNILSTRINNFTLDDINASHINGGTRNKCFTIDEDSNYMITADHGEFKFKNKVTFDSGMTVNGNITLQNSSLDFTNLGALSVTGEQTQSVFICNQIGTGNLALFKFKGIVKCILTNNGDFGIGGEGIFKDSVDVTERPVEKLHVIGNIIATGRVTSFYSDERLKTFTSKINNSLEIIDCLSGYRYVPNKLAIEKGFKYEEEIGLSAQQVQKVLPEIVKIAPFDSKKDEHDKIISKSGNNYLTICYERLGAVFVEAIKELNVEMKKLKEENNSLKEDIKNIKKILNI